LATANTSGGSSVFGGMTTEPTRHEIRNVALLDLTGAASGDLLERITRIRNVAAILVPESLMAKLMAVPMQNVAATVPIPDGKRVRVMSGQVMLSGEALAGGEDDADEYLVVAGQLVITSPVPHVGRKHIVAMGQVLAPVGSETGLGAALSRVGGQVMYYPYSPGANIRFLMGGRLSGAELANPNGGPNDVLLSVGQLVITGAVERVGYEHLVSIGQIVAPRESESVLTGRVTSLSSGVAYYTAPPRQFDGKDHFSAAFFELLDEPITLVLDGKFSFDDDVAPDLLKRKVSEIVLDGKIVAARRLVPMLQLLAVVRDGKITAFEDEDDVE
jgi:hypothetical protein